MRVSWCESGLWGGGIREEGEQVSLAEELPAIHAGHRAERECSDQAAAAARRMNTNKANNGLLPFSFGALICLFPNRPFERLFILMRSLPDFEVVFPKFGQTLSGILPSNLYVIISPPSLTCGRATTLVVFRCKELSLFRLVFTRRNAFLWLLHCASVLYAPQSLYVHAGLEYIQLYCSTLIYVIYINTRG